MKNGGKSKILENTLRATCIAAILTTGAMTACATKGVYDVYNNEYVELSEMLTNSRIKSNLSYVNHFSEKSNELNDKYISGKISDNQFLFERNELFSDYYLEKWAKTSDDEAVKKVVDEYNLKNDKYSKDMKKSMINLFASYGGLMTSFGLGSAVESLISHISNKKSKNKSSEMEL